MSAHTGNIGGTLSHEYHVTSSVGEDALLLCRRYNRQSTIHASCNVQSCKCPSLPTPLPPPSPPPLFPLFPLFPLPPPPPLPSSCSCGQGCNKELLCAGDSLEHSHTPSSLPDCPQDGRDCQLEETKGIEVSLVSLQRQLCVCVRIFFFKLCRLLMRSSWGPSTLVCLEPLSAARIPLRSECPYFHTCIRSLILIHSTACQTLSDGLLWSGNLSVASGSHTAQLQSPWR